jgi:RHS repeat-associated protein
LFLHINNFILCFLLQFWNDIQSFLHALHGFEIIVSYSLVMSMATFVYDGDGARVKSTINSTSIFFVGAHYEVSGSTVSKYYFAGIQRVAMRSGSTLYYLLADQLGSTSLTTNASGAPIAEIRYKPWGEVRASNGTTPTNYTYTGQYSNMGDFGLMFYNARWYDPAIGRFAQADTIIPSSQGVQAWDRYAYSNNNPILYTDPSGHCIVGALLGLFNITYSCPGAPPSGPYINVREKEKGIDIGDIDRPLPPDAVPGWVDPKDPPQGPGADINVGAPGDIGQEGFDPAPDNGSLNILAETEEGEDSDEEESPYGFPDNDGEPPVEGWEWVGKGEPGSSQGQWINPDNPKENLHWDDKNHLDQYPDGHWDYRDPDGNEYRIGPNGMTPK